MDTRVSCGHCGGSPRPLISIFQARIFNFSFKQLLIYPYEAEETPSETHYYYYYYYYYYYFYYFYYHHHYSENLGAPGIESGNILVCIQEL
jgi:hypothetical protein